MARGPGRYLDSGWMPSELDNSAVYGDLHLAEFDHGLGNHSWGHDHSCGWQSVVQGQGGPRLALAAQQVPHALFKGGVAEHLLSNQVFGMLSQGIVEPILRRAKLVRFHHC